MVNRNQSAHPLRDEELVFTDKTNLTQAPGADAVDLGTLDLGGSVAGVAGEMVSNRFRGKLVVEVHSISAAISQSFVAIVGANDTGFASGVIIAMIPMGSITGDGAAIARGVGKHQQPFENLAQAFDGTQRSFRYLRAFGTALGGTGIINLSVWLTKD